MRRNVLTIILVVVVLGLLVGLNALFMAQPGADEDERSGDRSSYKGTHYGTLAYYLLLSDLGYSVNRFEEPYTSLDGSGVGTLFVVTTGSTSMCGCVCAMRSRICSSSARLG